MGKRRGLWALAAVLTATLYVFGNNTGTLTLLLATLLLPPLGCLPLLGCRVRVQLHVPPAAAKGQTIAGVLTLQSAGSFPLPRVRAAVQYRNLRTGQAGQAAIERSLPFRRAAEQRFLLTCPHCGRVELRLERVEVFDLFGLMRRRIPCEGAAVTTILPDRFRPDLALDEGGMAQPDSDTYAANRPGNDPGETFAIRAYVPGDAIRQIHWKLSEKTDRLMVREFGQPVVEQALLLLETAGNADPAVQDALTEVFVSVSEELLRQGCVHRLGWQAADGSLWTAQIANAADFSAMLEALLALPPRVADPAAQSLTGQEPHCAAAHVLLVTPRVPLGVQALCNGNRVTLLLCGEGREGLQPDGFYALPFTPENYARTLCRMEV